jgi:hypothetical protein
MNSIRVQCSLRYRDTEKQGFVTICTHIFAKTTNKQQDFVSHGKKYHAGGGMYKILTDWTLESVEHTKQASVTKHVMPGTQTWQVSMYTYKEVGISVVTYVFPQLTMQKSIQLYCPHINIHNNYPNNVKWKMETANMPILESKQKMFFTRNCNSLQPVQ